MSVQKHDSKSSTAWLGSNDLEDERILTWPPSLLDLHLTGYMGILIEQEIYCKRRQLISLNSIWKALVAAKQKCEGQQNKKP